MGFFIIDFKWFFGYIIVFFLFEWMGISYSWFIDCVVDIERFGCFGCFV